MTIPDDLARVVSADTLTESSVEKADKPAVVEEKEVGDSAAKPSEGTAKEKQADDKAAAASPEANVADAAIAAEVVEKPAKEMDSWKPPLPRIPIVGSLNPVTKAADHDLLITLRILPQLVRYAGSLRCGLVSRGWGIGHDGNSMRIIACEKLAPGEAVKMVKHGMRKAAPLFGANHDDTDGYLMVMESTPTVDQGEVRTL